MTSRATDSSATSIPAREAREIREVRLNEETNKS
jgi:hypothetical protein